MNPFSAVIFRRMPRAALSLAAALNLAGALPLLAAASPAPADKPAIVVAPPPVIPKSEFVDDPQNGRDPFFPDSRRRMRGPAQAGVTSLQPQGDGIFSQLVLKGLSTARGHRLALINSITLAVGEKAEFKFDTQKVKVCCVEIRDHSVLVSIEGTSQVKELQLRKGL